MASLDMGSFRITPRDESHEDLGPQLNLVFWLLTSLSLVFLGLRLYCKIYRGRNLWWDDHFLIASWVGSPRTKTCLDWDTIWPLNV